MTRALWAVLAVGLFAASFFATALQAQPSEDSDKSNYFAGRCLAPILIGEEIYTEGLQQVPPLDAEPHLYGEPGEVYFGDSETVLLVRHKATHCGINVYDESLADVEGFMAFWLERENSPFALTDNTTDAHGNQLISYDGHCTECGFDVHARAYWIAEANFTIYRLFATKPEES